MLEGALKKVIKSLNKCEKDFIFSSLDIANSGPNSSSPYRFWFNDFRKNFNSREGDIYEFGVFRGSSLLSIAFLAKRLDSKKHFWGFDSFEGFPEFSENDDLKNFNSTNNFSLEHIENVNLLASLKITKKETTIDKKLSKLGKSKTFKNTSYENLLKKIEAFSLDNITLVKGNFDSTLCKHFEEKERKIFSANLDCDLYKGYKVCLPFIFNNLVEGGFINLDEYYSLKYPGARIATDEFLKNNSKAILKKNPTSIYEFDRYYITK